MESPATVNAPSPLHTAPDPSKRVPAPPESNAPPRNAPPVQADDRKHEASTHGRFSGAIHKLCVEFLTKVQEVFGTQSKEWEEIAKALLDFRRGDMSKRRTHSIMTQILGGSLELQQGLSDILKHDDARWGADDWSQPIISPESPQVANPVIPEFLQTQHEPHLVRLPSFFQALEDLENMSRPQPPTPAYSQPPSMQSDNLSPYQNFQASLVHHATNTGSFSAPGHNNEECPPAFQSAHITWSSDPFMRNGPTSSASMTTAHVPQKQASVPWSQYPSPTSLGDTHVDTETNSALSSHRYLGHGPEAGAPYVHTPQQFSQQHQPYQDWSNNSTITQHWQYGQDRAMAPRQDSNYPISQPETVPYLHREQQGSSVLCSTAGMPMMGIASGLSSSNAPYEHEKLKVMATSNDTYNPATAFPGNSKETKNTGPGTLTSIGDEEGVWYRDMTTIKAGPYVHAICGKGFPTRSAVKKHHWGPNSGDLETTRGCWAKNNKPDVAWDAHTSCQEGPKRRHKRFTTENNNVVAKDVKFTAPFAPSMVPMYQTKGHETTSTHGLDTLVSSASYTEKLAVPKPQNGRNDSVVAYLDAQAAAAESNRQEAPPWMTPTGYGSAITGNNIYSRMHPPIDSSGFIQNHQKRIQPMEVLPSQTQEATGSGAFAAEGCTDTADGSKKEKNVKSDKEKRPSEKLLWMSATRAATSKDDKMKSKGPSSARIRKK